MGCNRRMVACSRAVVVLALALGGCALPQSAPPPLPPPVAAAPLPAAPSSGWAWSAPLESAGARLRSALAGSGAEVSQTPDQRLWIALPGEAVFPAGRSAVTPAAGAWLDKIAAALGADGLVPTDDVRGAEIPQEPRLIFAPHDVHERHAVLRARLHQHLPEVRRGRGVEANRRHSGRGRAVPRAPRARGGDGAGTLAECMECGRWPARARTGCACRPGRTADTGRSSARR